MKQIPVNSPLITEDDISAVEKSLRDGWISGDSPVVSLFESNFSRNCNRRFGVSVTNGTSAIELLIHALGITKGDEVILPSFAIISCVSQILRCGATPVFVDSDETTWNMDVAKVEQLVTSRTKAILAVHTYGLPTDVDILSEIASRHNLLLIEDAAEAHGLLYKGRKCGSFGVASTFSFYANKNITTGEGGMILTDDELLYKKLCYFRNLTFNPEQRFVHEDLGWNLRMSSLQCALGSSQLTRLDKIVSRRREIGQFYTDAFSKLSDLRLPLTANLNGLNDFWVYGIVLAGRFQFKRQEIVEGLSRVGIGTRPFFWPLHLQPVLSKYGLSTQPKLPVAEDLGMNGFYIPNGLGMSDVDIEYVADQIRLAFK